MVFELVLIWQLLFFHFAMFLKVHLNEHKNNKTNNKDERGEFWTLSLNDPVVCFHFLSGKDVGKKNFGGC